MNKDIEKEVLDLLKQELATKTYVVKYREDQRSGRMIKSEWLAVSTEDNVNLVTMSRLDDAIHHVVTGKDSSYSLSVMGKEIYSNLIASEQPESQEAKDAKLPENVRAVFDLLKRELQIRRDARAAVRAQLAARVAMRTKGK